MGYSFTFSKLKNSRTTAKPFSTKSNNNKSVVVLGTFNIYHQYQLCRLQMPTQHNFECTFFPIFFYMHNRIIRNERLFYWLACLCKKKLNPGEFVLEFFFYINVCDATYPDTSHLNAHMKHLTLCFGISIITT